MLIVDVVIGGGGGVSVLKLERDGGDWVAFVGWQAAM